MDPKQEASLRVQGYLYKNKARLQYMTVDFIFSEVRNLGPDSKDLLDSELRATIAVWLSLNRAVYTLPVTPAPTLPDSKLIDAIKKGVTTVIDGVDVVRSDDGKINVSISGLTAELAKGDGKVSANISWGGTLSVETQKGDFHLSGELSSEKWSVTLSWPQDTYVPDLSKLGKVFGEGESAMRKIASATASFRGLQDVERVKAAISPHVDAVSEAVDAVKSVAKKPAKNVSFGFTLGSPNPMPGESGIPRGVQGTATLTFWF
jgi:hypothetical protein